MQEDHKRGQICHLQDFRKVISNLKKFHHACWHMGWSITRFGALWVTCAGRWEHFHQTLKFQYKVSSKRSKEYASEMVKNLRDLRILALAQLHLQEIALPLSKCTYSNPEPGCSRMLGSAVTINMNCLHADVDGDLPFEADLYIAVCAIYFCYAFDSK